MVTPHRSYSVCPEQLTMALNSPTPELSQSRHSIGPRQMKHAHLSEVVYSTRRKQPAPPKDILIDSNRHQTYASARKPLPNPPVANAN